MKAHLLLAENGHYFVMKAATSLPLKCEKNQMLSFLSFHFLPAVMALNHLNLLRALLARQVRPPVMVASRVQAPLPHPSATCLPAACARLYATKKSKGQ